MTTNQEEVELLNRIRAALGDNPSDNAIALSFVLAEQALQMPGNNATIGSPSEVKYFVNGLTDGMIAICAGSPTTRE